MTETGRVGGAEAVPGYQPLRDGMSASDELWSFVVGLYKSDRVEPWCLEWQRRYGLDISFFLWAGWLQHRHRCRLTEAQITDAIAEVSAWRSHVITPVREARKFLKTSGFAATHPDAYDELRRHLRAAELAGERSEQERLVAYSTTLSFEPADPGGRRSNMVLYLGTLAGELRGDDLDRAVEIDRLAAAIATAPTT